MRSPLRGLRDGLLNALGVDPEPVIATLWVGPEAACIAMEAKMRALLPQYRHLTVQPAAGETPRTALANALRHHRIGMIAALPEGWGAALRTNAFRTMAFNSRGENWFVKWSDPISSTLFLRGLPLDRIKLRPWFWPFTKPRGTAADSIGIVEGRPKSPIRASFAVLSPYAPWPLGHGGAVRIYNLLREASREFDIDLYVFTEDNQPLESGPLTALCHRIVHVEKPRYREPRWSTLLPPEVCEYRSAAMQRAIQGVRPLQIEYTQLASYAGDILVEHDVTFDLYEQLHRRDRRLASWWNWYRWRRFEQAAVRRMRPVAMSAKDATMLGMGNASVIGNGVDLERFQPQPEQPARNLLFIGSFRHFPNVSAFQWFWREVWPLLDDCRLVVVGGPDAEYHWHQYTQGEPLPSHENLELHSFVADVRPLYDEANVVVVPTLVSAGTNLKVLEAMAMRRAVVSTPSGVGGIYVQDGESVLVAETPADFAASIERLLADADLRASIAQQACLVAHTKYSWRALGKLQAALWHELSPAPLSIESGKSWRAEFENEHSWIALLSEEPAACLTWRKTADQEFELLWIETVGAHRRLGIANRLLEHALEQAPGDWFLEVRVSNTAAQALYTRLGFVQTGLRRNYYSNPDEDALVMHRQA